MKIQASFVLLSANDGRDVLGPLAFIWTVDVWLSGWMYDDVSDAELLQTKANKNLISTYEYLINAYVECECNTSRYLTRGPRTCEWLLVERFIELLLLAFWLLIFGNFDSCLARTIRKYLSCWRYWDKVKNEINVGVRNCNWCMRCWCSLTWKLCMNKTKLFKN